MSIPSNLYAEKVYAEHPIALWTLDDQADYISLITETGRKISTFWTLSECTATTVDSTAFPFPPFPESNTTLIASPLGGGTTITLTGAETFNPANLEEFCISLYMYSYSTRITSIKVGYQEGSNTPVLNTVDMKPDDEDPTRLLDRYWNFISERFSAVDKNIKIVIEVTFSDTSSQNSFLLNGIAVGRHSEEFNGSSLGTYTVSAPYVTNGVPANAYASNDYVGYYAAVGGNLYARNSGIPMVYGSSSSTSISYSSFGTPGLILPGLGFMNDSGKHRDLSLELWLRVIGNTQQQRRIIGPKGSTDGVYIKGSYITLKVGENYSSHYLGEMDRPMLLTVNIYSSGANMLINGDEVISMRFSTIDIDFPNGTEVIGEATVSQDWLYFSSHLDITINVDCVAIYPYVVDPTLAKKRFVYAQGVDFPEQVNRAYFGESFVTDYAYSQFGHNYNYPDAGKWGFGVADALASKDNTLTNITYPKPTVKFANSEESAWLEDEYSSGKTSVEFTEGHNGYLLFEDQSYFNSTTRAVYGFFNKKDSEILEPQTLIRIENPATLEYLEAHVSGEEVEGTNTYKISYVFSNAFGQVETLAESTEFEESEEIIAGFDLATLREVSTSEVSSFLSSTRSLKVYVGNSPSFDARLDGDIYSVSFVSSQGWLKVDQFFSSETGLPASLNVVDGNDINATYTARFSSHFDIPKMAIDVSSSGYWYDTVPLKMLSQSVSGETEGTKEYTLDYVQFDIDVPTPRKNGISFQIDGSEVRTYIHFQASNVTGIVGNLSDVQAPSNMTVTPSEDWQSERYEVVSGSIIYMPEDPNILDYMMVVTIESNLNEIHTKPLFIRYMHLAARSLNKSGENFISSKNGKKAYPYVVVNNEMDFSAKNPIVISKQSMPYFYATDKTGISVAGDYSGSVDRGVMFKLNETLAPFFSVASIQAYIKWLSYKFPTTEQTIASFESNNLNLNIKIKAYDSLGVRGEIFAKVVVDGVESSSRYKGIAFYQNGSVVKHPVIKPGEWNAIGISMLSPLNLNSSLGYIKVNGNILFNNLSFYQAPKEELGDKIALRIWESVSADDWSEWSDEDGETWNSLLITTATPGVFGISPELIYKTFTGTDRVIVNSDVFSTKLLLNKYQYKIFNDYISNVQLLSAR